MYDKRFFYVSAFYYCTQCSINSCLSLLSVNIATTICLISSLYLLGLYFFSECCLALPWPCAEITVQPKTRNTHRANVLEGDGKYKWKLADRKWYHWARDSSKCHLVILPCYSLLSCICNIIHVTCITYISHTKCIVFLI